MGYGRECVGNPWLMNGSPPQRSSIDCVDGLPLKRRAGRYKAQRSLPKMEDRDHETTAELGLEPQSCRGYLELPGQLVDLISPTMGDQRDAR